MHGSTCLFYRNCGVYLFFILSFELLTMPERASKERSCSLKLFLPLWLFLPPSLPTKGWLISSGAWSPFYHLAPYEIGYNDWGSILRLPIAFKGPPMPFSYSMYVCLGLWRGYCKFCGKQKCFLFQLNLSLNSEFQLALLLFWGAPAMYSSPNKWKGCNLHSKEYPIPNWLNLQFKSAFCWLEGDTTS